MENALNATPALLGEVVQEITDLFDAQGDALFYGHGTDNAWDEAVFLVLTLMNLPPDSDESVSTLEVPEEIQLETRRVANERIQSKKPLPYLLKTAYFKGLRFYVDERVLIPRSAFGELILNRFSPWIGDLSPQTILEIGTGSGCMAILTALVFEDAHIVATDISPAALEVARKNIEDYGLTDRITLIESDLFNEIPVQQFDLIMSNPPYVDALDMSTLPPEYHHEPALALESGQDGLHHTREILRQAKTYLNPNGMLFVEVGNSFEALEAAYPRTPFLWIDFEDGECEIFALPYPTLIETT
jgi:ribosomal protein L3 glutamine methyltransferase